jgi:hypothetical protein
MNLRQFISGVVVLALSTFLPACGGGGGGGPADAGIVLTQVTVTTQQAGPLSPFGTTQGGDEVKLTGRGFAVGLSVHFGSVAGTVTQVQSGEVTVITPAGPDGTVDITVTLQDGSSSTFDDAYRYVAPPVIVDLIVLTGPTTGETRVPIAGGETIRLNGSNFKAGMTLTVDGRNLPVTLIDDQQVTFVCPARDAEASLDIDIRNPEGLAAHMNRGLVYTQEFSLDADLSAFTPARARHLFRRAAFGATPTRIDQAVSDGLANSVDGLMTFSNPPCRFGAPTSRPTRRTTTASRGSGGRCSCSRTPTRSRSGWPGSCMTISRPRTSTSRVMRSSTSTTTSTCCAASRLRRRTTRATARRASATTGATC